MVRSWLCVTACALSALACSRDAVHNADVEPVASLKVTLSGDFSGSSVRICGSRPEPSALFNCEAALPAAPCPCFDLDEPVELNGLCTSRLAPESDWTFSYTLYAEAGCQGEVLNATGSDLTCYDAQDLRTQSNANQSVEALEAGVNSNQIVCVTQTASKTWNFESCADMTTQAERTSGRSRYDCDCAVVDGSCACGSMGVAASDLEDGCVFEVTTCDLVCSQNDQFLCDDSVYISSRTGTATDLRRIDPAQLNESLISETAEFGYDAIGLNPLDDFIYGISNASTSGDATPHLLRITQRGLVVDLGAIAALAGEEWILGTFLADGTYLIGNFAFNSQRWVKLTASGTIVDSGTVTLNAGGIITAWATSPIDNLVYGYDSINQQLVTFDPNTEALTYLNPPLTNVGPRPCSAAFTKSGSMLLYCKTADPDTDALFDVSTQTPSATFRTSARSLGAGDMASCPFSG